MGVQKCKIRATLAYKANINLETTVLKKVHNYINVYHKCLPALPLNVTKITTGIFIVKEASH